MPVITSIIVVLPAPLGPITQRSSPASTTRLRSFSALKPSKLTEMESRYRMPLCEMSTPFIATRPSLMWPLAPEAPALGIGVALALMTAS